MQLREKVAESQLTSKEKEKLLEKAAQLSAENVGLKAAIDEMTALKCSLEDRVKSLEEDLKHK